jgi:glycosyltransferase involved in cell wall biosynthesis
MKTIALVPAYQAGRTVGRVVAALRDSWPESGQSVVVVDDGSTDDTAPQAEAAGALVVRHGCNRGKGAALVSGLRRASQLGAEIAVSVDADGQHLPGEAVRLARYAAPDEALVLGIRDLGRAGAPRAHRLSNGISNFFLSGFTGVRLLDTQCGLRRYPIAPTLALGVRDSGYAFEAEVLIRAARARWEIFQVPIDVVYSAESRAHSHFRAARDPARIVGRVLYTMMTRRGSR